VIPSTLYGVYNYKIIFEIERERNINTVILVGRSTRFFVGKDSRGDGGRVSGG
jgi:hypothetical protein